MQTLIVGTFIAALIALLILWRIAVVGIVEGGGVVVGLFAIVLIFWIGKVVAPYLDRRDT